MPGRGTAPGDSYPECLESPHKGIRRHRAERTRNCARCRAYTRARTERYRKQRYLHGRLKISALGSQRRIRALMRIGWPQQTLECRWGLGRKTLGVVLLREEITREKAELIRAGYLELAFQGAGPSQRIRKWAERRGWAGPLDWDDIEDPGEIPACELEAAHREALAVHREFKKMISKREKRASMTEADRQAARHQRRRREAA